MDKEALLERLTTQATAASRLERRAMLMDREANDVYRALLMKDRVGESFDATVTGVAEHGLYVTFEEPFVEARVPVDALGADWYELDSLGLRLVGQRSGHAFALGDRLTVRLENVSVPERELRAVVEDKLPDDRELLSPPWVQRKRRQSQERRGSGKGERRPERRPEGRSAAQGTRRHGKADEPGRRGKGADRGSKSSRTAGGKPTKKGKPGHKSKRR